MRRRGTGEVRLWVPGDWNGFFGLFTNVLLNVIVLTGLCLGVVQLPADTVFGRILPALGIALPLGNLFYAYLAWQLGKKEGRSDVTAMPYGPSVPHMFIVVFLIMLPVYLQDQGPDARVARRARVVLHHRRHRAARRVRRAADPRDDAARGDARHARRHLDRLHLDAPGVPDVGDAVDRPRVLRDRADRLDREHAAARRPARRARRGDRRLGDRLGRRRSLGWSDYMQPAAVGKSLEQFGLHLPMFSADVWAGLAQVAPLLVTAIPLGIYNFTEAMNNVESASAAGDNYNLRKILLADGLGAIVGSMLGSPFPPAVYIGHPGLEGGRRTHRLLARHRRRDRARLLPRPHRAAARGDPAGRDPADPALHRPRHRRAGVPGLAVEARAGGRAGAHPEHRRVGEDADRRRARRGRHVGGAGRAGQARRHRRALPGLESLGGGSVLAGMVLGAMAVFIIDSKMRARRRVGVRRRDPRVRRPDPRRAARLGACRRWSRWATRCSASRASCSRAGSRRRRPRA